MNLLNRLHNNTTVIIGLSGGADSIYLLYRCVELRAEKNLTLIAVHLDHEWRSESWKDAEFCKNACAALDVTCVINKASELNFTPRATGSKEDLGRQLRRFCFESAQQKYNADYIALAHHQDDQIETFFIRLIRGATLKGLGGMQEQDGLYIRPLLNISKKTILNFLTEKNITFVEDSSNLSDEYLRNRIRNKALPVLQACDNRLNMKCIQAINHLQETEHFLTTLTETHYNQIITKKTDTDYNILNIKQLMDLDLYLQKRIVQMFIIKHKVPFNLSNNFLEEILKFIHSNKGGSHCVGPSWKLIKKQSNLWIELL